MATSPALGSNGNRSARGSVNNRLMRKSLSELVKKSAAVARMSLGVRDKARYVKMVGVQ